MAVAPKGLADGSTLTILGCGTLGTAILSGILASLAEASTDSSTTTDAPPPRTPTKFIACVRRPQSAQRIKQAVEVYPQTVTILQNENIKGVMAADVVILGCKPQMVADILGDGDMKSALEGKLLISICAGVTVPQMEGFLQGQHADPIACRVVRAMPNTAAIVRESMTFIGTSTPPLPPSLEALITWIFTRIGRVVHVSPANMDVSTALCGSGPAFVALMLEALADGAVAMGLPRADAQLMAAQTMRGTTGMVLSGEHPALIRDKVSTPGGCTIGGLLVLEEGAVRGAVARSVREATVVASQLGKGASGVNGTRFGIK